MTPPVWADTVPVGPSLLNRLSNALDVLDTNTQYAQATSELTLNTSFQDVPGVAITVNHTGYYRIRGQFDMSYGNVGDDGWELYGILWVSTRDTQEIELPKAILKWIYPYRIVVRQTWAMELTENAVLKLQARRQGGSGGSSCRYEHTTLMATLRGT